MLTNKWHIIGRGFNGWHATGVDCSSSGGDLLGYTYWTGKECSGYAAEAVEGAPVYDASGLDDYNSTSYDLFVNFVCNGPMVKPGLKKGEAINWNNGFVDFSMDNSELLYVSVEDYCSLLKKIVQGIKWGKVKNGVCEWD